MHPQTRAGDDLLTLQLGLDGVLQPDQDDIDVRVLAQKIERRLDCHMGTVIAPHGINGDSDFAHEQSTQGNRFGKPGIDSGQAATKSAVVSLGIEHFAATIKAGRADMVTQMHFAGGRLDRRRRRGQKIVGTMHATLGGGFLVLLNGHDYLQKPI
jgi:hypothetical protein